MIKNSPLSKAGWVQFQHRAGVGHTMNAYSLPDSNHGWNKKSLVLEWRSGDWGEFFRTSFSCTVDSPYFIFKLDIPELHARDKLSSDNGQTHFRCFVNERKLAEPGLSGLSLKGIKFPHFNLWISLFFYSNTFLFTFQLPMLWMSSLIRVMYPLEEWSRRSMKPRVVFLQRFLISWTTVLGQGRKELRARMEAPRLLLSRRGVSAPKTQFLEVLGLSWIGPSALLLPRTSSMSARKSDCRSRRCSELISCIKWTFISYKSILSSWTTRCLTCSSSFLRQIPILRLLPLRARP